MERSIELPIDESPSHPKIHCIFSPSTRTWSYIIADPASNHAIIIDPLLSRVPSTNVINTSTPDALLKIIYSKHYIIDHILETNAHEIHYPSATWYLRTQILERTGRAPRIAVQKSLRILQRLYARKYAIREKFWAGEFDGKFLNGETLTVGNLQVRVLYLPGTSPDHVGYLVGESQLVMGDCWAHVEGEEELPAVVGRCLRMSRERVMGLSEGLRIWTTRACPAKLVEGEGCVGEVREEHLEWYHLPRTGVAGGLDEGLVT